jgi:hypothetical protein
MHILRVQAAAVTPRQEPTRSLRSQSGPKISAPDPTRHWTGASD